MVWVPGSKPPPPQWYGFQFHEKTTFLWNESKIKQNLIQKHKNKRESAQTWKLMKSLNSNPPTLPHPLRHGVPVRLPYVYGDVGNKWIKMICWLFIYVLKTYVLEGFVCDFPYPLWTFSKTIVVCSVTYPFRLVFQVLVRLSGFRNPRQQWNGLRESKLMRVGFNNKDLRLRCYSNYLKNVLCLQNGRAISASDKIGRAISRRLVGSTSHLRVSTPSSQENYVCMFINCFVFMLIAH